MAERKIESFNEFGISDDSLPAGVAPTFRNLRGVSVLAKPSNDTATYETYAVGTLELELRQGASVVHVKKLRGEDFDVLSLRPDLPVLSEMSPADRDLVAALNFEPTTDEAIHCRAIGVVAERTHQTVSEAERYLDQARDRSAGPSSGYKEKVIFLKRRGKTMAKPGFSDDALLNSYELFSNELAQVRNCASRPRTISPSALRKLFIGTELFLAADDEDWKKWIEDLASGATAKGAALVFLESKTGRKRRSIETLCSNERGRRKTRTLTTIENH